ncbi:peptide ABC transporter substrate-binding protein [Haloplanus litoreus]|uniref:Peptide ABC transporter substrate-binding protein n=1 Tax=Haloplanus litoreus TaxID=767515 RepID=A0ABD5ZT43_9EURY
MHESFQDRILSAVDVCNNCFAVVREQRLKAKRNWEVSREAYWSRRNRQTTVEFAPADSVSEQKGIFCDCGVEGSYERIWDDREIGRDRFKRYIQQIVATLESKGLSVDRQRLAAYALTAYDERLPPDVVGPEPESVPSINEALARGVVRGLHDSTTLDQRETTDRVRV